MKTVSLAFFLISFIPGIHAQDPVSFKTGDFKYLSEEVEDCPSGYTCLTFEVNCPGSEPAKGTIAYAAHTADQPKGLIMLFKGGEGTSYWTNNAEAFQMAEDFRKEGYSIVQVKWIDSWLLSSPGIDAGIAHLAGRPATVIKKVYEEYFVPLETSAEGSNEIQFCLTGNSGGASQISYALSHYGLDTILDVVIPTGGPPHATLAKSMLQRPEEEEYWYDERRRDFIDKGFGFFDGNGPGVRLDTSFVKRWIEESVATGGNDYYHPNTRLHFIIGGNDREMYHVSRDYIYRLFEEGNPDITFEIVPGTPHNILKTEQGKAALFDALTGHHLPVVKDISSQVDLLPTYSDIRYGRNERNVFDFWAAKSDQPTPLVVYIHGGGFIKGDKSSALDSANAEYIKRCLENGVSFAAINYRYNTTTQLDTIMLHAARAIQFFRNKARRLNIDKDKIAAYGGSAGGGISLWLAVHDDLADKNSDDPVLRESSKVTVAGHLHSQATYDFSRWPEFLDLPEGWAVGIGSDLQLYKIPDGSWYDAPEIVALRKDLDMIGMIDSADPPVYLKNLRSPGSMEKRGDITHHPSHAIYLREQLDKKGVDNALVIESIKEKDREDMLDFFFKYLLAE